MAYGDHLSAEGFDLTRTGATYFGIIVENDMIEVVLTRPAAIEIYTLTGTLSSYTPTAFPAHWIAVDNYRRY